MYYGYKPNYSALEQYLLGQTDEVVMLSFDKIEQIIEASLPNSARMYAVWWSSSGHSHAQTWEKSGYKAVNVSRNISKNQMQFERRHMSPASEQMPHEENSPHPQMISDIKPSKSGNNPIVLISCSKRKLTYPCEARLLYSASNLFSKSLEYAQLLSDEIFILSARYGLVPLDERIEPYEETLNDKTSEELAAWGKRVAEQLAGFMDIDNTEFVILAGKNYYSPLKAYLPRIRLPLIGLPFGKRMEKLDALIGTGRQYQEKDTICLRLHKLFNRMPRYRWDTIDKIAFNSGVYILFESGEKYCGMDRIVRVGTHRSDGRLRERLKDHFIRENKDRSIFRKNIGKAVLNKNRHPYLNIWRIDTSKAENIARLGDRDVPEFQKKVEERVTQYMREHFSFVCFPAASEQVRLRLEEGIIAALNNDSGFKPSSEWRGQHSTEHEIVQSGLWLKQGLDGTPLSDREFAGLEELCLMSE